MGTVYNKGSSGGTQRYSFTTTGQCTSGNRTLTVNLSNYSNVPTDINKFYVGISVVNSANYSVTDVAIYKNAINNKVLTLKYTIDFASQDASKTYRLEYFVCF
jgi:hypothetical protein